PPLSREEQLLAAAVAPLPALAAGAAARGVDWQSANVEWSQSGPQHSGRAYLTSSNAGIVRLDLPDETVAALAQLRAELATPERGAWLSALVSVTPDGGRTVTYEWDARPYWNATGVRMVPQAADAVPAVAIPDDEQWLADLQTYPRSPEHLPEWLRNSTANPGAAFAELARRFEQVGYPREAVVLPGVAGDGQTPLEGAMEVRQSGARRYEIGVRDYGTFEPFASVPTEREACEWLWSYLSAAPPVATAVPRYDLEQRSASYRPAYAQLYAQLQAGGGATLTVLPPGVALDRIGALDGVFLFPWATPMPNRSLPPVTSSNARLYQFVTMQPLHVEAEIVQPWFGQPGGSLRFRIAADNTGVRQLLRGGQLVEVTVGP
ncbi:MAG TPA: hypothetical protein DHV14_08145, partial [Micrococcales bacterium]|nr:hypothetical protein [Micrococcales bacterium]